MYPHAPARACARPRIANRLAFVKYYFYFFRKNRKFKKGGRRGAGDVLGARGGVRAVAGVEGVEGVSAWGGRVPSKTEGGLSSLILGVRGGRLRGGCGRRRARLETRGRSPVAGDKHATESDLDLPARAWKSGKNRAFLGVFGVSLP